MRISSIQTFTTSVNRIVDLTGQVGKTQSQISAGTRILQPSDDPVNAAKILDLQRELDSRDQYIKDINLLENRAKLEEATLKTVNDTLIRVRELTTQAGNGALIQSDKEAIAAELKQRLDELKNLMNTKDTSGEYLFAGYKGNTEPFVDTGNRNFLFEGDEGQRYIQISNTVSIPASDSGKDIFVDIKSAQNTFTTLASDSNTAVPPATVSVGVVVDQEAYDEFYPEDIIIEFQNPDERTLVGLPAQANFNIISKSDGRVLKENQPFISGKPIEINGVQVQIEGNPNTGDTFLIESSENQGLLTSVSRLIYGLETLGTSDEDKKAYNQLIEDSINNLKSAENSILETRAEIGARLNTMDSTRKLHEDLKLVSTELLSDIRDLDFAQASSQLSFESFVLQAAQQSYVKIAGLSLFNSLR
ncbi:flagellar hook-associated protein FlgL [Pseudoteredinibacter isoporae]|uniref:Flagellar hook-associated protein 3 FlgL n=1 Tax=Pseudoteredinibacter isoporae TaxID=570281 RepID=A0A7X0MYW0_9GAMM|nr:flagellar hook-associated protein FlgL [Pseudoteredinibacter isoporae]MBB6523489.1 flagellar hook-associated protein 3 FlgL [Pseudoteredinibacter isoporae]NHO88998.1 flagellar hook-associated protein 3 [Pseudoteredinibacter isoporae]NIB24294.1 flagellar hook-associated protein 3 [Pseudoteredinibacter isoporae]